MLDFCFSRGISDAAEFCVLLDATLIALWFFRGPGDSTLETVQACSAAIGLVAALIVKFGRESALPMVMAIAFCIASTAAAAFVYTVAFVESAYFLDVYSRLPSSSGADAWSLYAGAAVLVIVTVNHVLLAIFTFRLVKSLGGFSPVSSGASQPAAASMV